MYCGDVQGRLDGLDPLRQLGWVKRLSKRWEGCHCCVRHNQEFCQDCYENKDSHQNAINQGEQVPYSYTIGGYSYLVPLKDYDRWIRPVFENQQAGPVIPLFKQIGLFFQETNAPLCEIWFVEEGADN